jgi:hypothetical protein
MNAAYTSLRTSLADALLAGALKEDDKTKADGLKTLCKQLSEECAVIADNSTNALDRDKAKEDNSKLQFRGRLQESIAKFASGVAELDVQLGQLAKTWSITPETGVATADSLRTSGGGSSSARAGQSAASTTDAEGWIKLLDPTHINEWSNGKAEKVTLGLNPRGFLNVNHTNYCWGNPAHDQIIRAKMHKFPGPPGDSASLLLRHSKGSGYNASLSGGVFTIGKSTEGKYAVLATVKREQKGGDAVQLEFAAVGDLLTLSVEGKEVMRVHDKSIQRGVAGVGAYNAQADFSDIEIKILDQNPPVKP